MTAPAAKRCTRCGQTMPLSEFGTCGLGAQGQPLYRPSCRPCTAAGHRERRAGYKQTLEADTGGSSARSPDWPEDERTQPGYTHTQNGYELPAVGPHESQPAVEKLDQVTEHRLRTRVRELESANRRLIADLSDAQAFADLHAQSIEERSTAATIEPREQASGLREGTALILASDWHIEEEVRPEMVVGRNRYNLEISARRMERFFQSARWGINYSRQAFQIRDAVLWLGGDFITNYLRDENLESNLLSPVEAIAYAFDSLSAGIRFLLEDTGLERLVIPCSDGNHGRLTKKPQVNTRQKNSIEWLLYHQLATAFAHEPRVEFKIAQGELLHLDIYGRTVRFTHGDAVQYQGGIGGITIPIYKALAGWATVRPADLTCMGHWHQYTQLRDLIVNGSLIGFSPFSIRIKARFEPPAQAFTILEPKRFNSVSMPLWVSDVADDEAAA